MGTIVTDISQDACRILNDRRTFIRPDRRNSVNHIRNPVGIGHNHFFCFLSSQVLKLLQHLLCGPKVQRRLQIRISKSLIGHDDPSVYFIFRIQKMHITGGADRLVEFLSHLHNLPVQILQISDRADLCHLRIADHKFIVAGGPNLQIIIKIYNSCNFFFRSFIHNGSEKLSRLTGRSED